MEPGKSWHTKEYFASWAGPQDKGSREAGDPASASSAAAPAAPAATATAQETPAQRGKIESPRPGQPALSGMSREAPAAKAPGASPGIAAGFLTRKGNTRGTDTKESAQGRAVAATPVRAGAAAVLPRSAPPAGSTAEGLISSEAAAGLTASEPAAGMDATEEKERGNDMYRKGRFEEAVRCYSHSLALDPTAVAFANRAMAFLKLTRYEEAERDCSEALERDDEYVKALSRRATARLRLKRPLEALQDIEAALSLEPGSKDLVSLREQAEKAICATPKIRPISPPAAKQAQESPSERRVQVVEDQVPGQATRAPEAVAPEPARGTPEAAPGREADPATAGPQGALPCMREARDDVAGMAGSTGGPESQAGVPEGGAGSRSGTKGAGVTQEGGVQEGSSLVAKSMQVLWQQRLVPSPPGSAVKPPQSAYEFEAAWRSLGSMQEEQGPAGEHAGHPSSPLDSASSAERGAKLAYLKTLEASKLPALLKDSLSGPLLLDILRTVLVPSFLLKGDEFRSWALTFLDNLQRTPRFGIASLCFTAPMRADLAATWAAAGGLEARQDLSVPESESLSSLAKTLRIDKSTLLPGCKQGS